MRVLKKHAGQEFEIQIRDGHVSQDSQEVLDVLKKDFNILQVEENIDRIIVDNSSCIQNQSCSTMVMDLLMGIVKTSILEKFDQTLQNVQNAVKKARRVADNELAKEKCKAGPVIHNFTGYEIPDELSKFMESGLGNVPEVTVEKNKVVSEIETEVKEACKNLFISLVGSYPKSISMKCTLDSFIKSLIVKAPNNQELLNSLILMRDNYNSRLPAILNTPYIGTCDLRKIKKLIPDNIILSPSDKNLGACLLPPAWFEKQGQIFFHLRDKNSRKDISLLKDYSLEM